MTTCGGERSEGEGQFFGSFECVQTLTQFFLVYIHRNWFVTSWNAMQHQGLTTTKGPAIRKSINANPGFRQSQNYPKFAILPSCRKHQLCLLIFPSFSAFFFLFQLDLLSRWKERKTQATNRSMNYILSM